jgi:hypothetical protein
MIPLRPRKTRIAMALSGLALCLSISVAATLASAQQPAESGGGGGAGPWKDLQVLPKDIAKPQLKILMKEQSKALGVDCDHCHKEPDMAAEHPKKTIAREMMKMTAELNKKYRSTTNGKVTCWSCHRGEARPKESPK